MSTHTMHGKQVEMGKDRSPNQEGKQGIFGFGVRLRRCEVTSLRKCEQLSRRATNIERKNVSTSCGESATQLECKSCNWLLS